jgi:DNA-binding winged helix-turn-helix (wHTH) protein/tetratricopeptide (TPR) repeat protein
MQGQQREHQEMIYAFGPYELDTRIYELRHAGTPRSVEPQVFDVLAYLVANRDRVVPKEELLEKLWPDRFVSESTLTSRLKEARKAVGDSGRSQSLIRTHHGRGYRFVAAVEERTDPLAYALTVCSGDHLVAASPGSAGPAVETSAPAAENRPAAKSDFVGRRDELSRLEGALGRALGGARQIVFVTGEAGAGKTTLVRQFLARHAPEPLLVARGQCVEHRGSGEPYMPLLDALGRLCRGDGGSRVLDLLELEAPSWVLQIPSLLSDEELTAVTARAGVSGERMLRELGGAVERLTLETPLVLVLDDLHWSDSATLEAIDLLARQTHPARFLLIGTYRPADVKATRHPAYAVVQELRVRGLCDAIDLPLLVPEELGEYLGRRFPGGDFTRELAPLLHERTAGNPLFMENVVDSWISHGMIRAHAGRWTVERSLDELESDVPDTLQHLIEKQISELDPEQQRALETASVLGRTFSVAAVAATLPAADEDLEKLCETLSRDGHFLRASGSEQWGDGTFTSCFAFSHDLYVDCLYERIPVARRSRIHRQVGLALERAWSGREMEHAPELALHFQRAADHERALRYLRLAAEQAIARSAYREAVVHLVAASEILDQALPSADRDRTELDVRSRLAPALTATRGWADPFAEQNYLRASELARSLGDIPLLSQTLYGMANMYEYRGEYSRAEQITRERLELAGEDSSMRLIESHELLACSMLHQGRFREAVEHGERALSCSEGDAPRDLGQIVLLVQAHGWISGALVFAGRPDDAVAHGQKALALADSAGDDLAKASAAIQAAFVRFYRREPDECRELTEIGLGIARERRFPFHVGCGRILSGWWMSLQNRHEEALREIRAGLRTSQSIGSHMDVPLFLAILAEALSRAGETEEALGTIEEGLTMLERNRSFFYAPELHRMHGHLLLEKGEPEDGAIACFRRALELGEEQESPLFALRAAMSLARLDGEGDAQKRVRSICRRFIQGHDLADLREARELLSQRATV